MQAVASPLCAILSSWSQGGTHLSSLVDGGAVPDIAHLLLKFHVLCTADEGGGQEGERGAARIAESRQRLINYEQPPAVKDSPECTLLTRSSPQ